MSSIPLQSLSLHSPRFLFWLPASPNKHTNKVTKSIQPDFFVLIPKHKLHAERQLLWASLFEEIYLLHLLELITSMSEMVWKQL